MLTSEVLVAQGVGASKPWHDFLGSIEVVKSNDSSIVFANMVSSLVLQISSDVLATRELVVFGVSESWALLSEGNYFIVVFMLTL